MNNSTNISQTKSTQKNTKFCWQLVFFMLCSLTLASTIHAEIIFQDNFDNQPDWAAGQEGSAGNTWTWPETSHLNCTSAGVNCPPAGWNSYRCVKSNTIDPGRDTFIINTDGARGGTGKGLTQNIDSADNYGQFTGGSLNVWLGLNGYRDLYIRYYAKYPMNWPTSSHALQKMYRISTFDEDVNNNPSKNPFSFDPGEGNYPVCYTDWLSNYVYGYAYITTAFRQAPDYAYIEESSHTNVSQPSDNDWHSYETHVRMNSAEGVADGVYEFFIDGQLAFSKNDVVWKSNGSNTYNWNWIMFFDNASIPLGNADTDFTVYYDDIVISTTYIGTDNQPSIDVIGVTVE